MSGGVWHSRDRAVTCRRASTRFGVGQGLQRALSSIRGHHTAHPCDRCPTVHMLRCNNAPPPARRGIPTRDPKGDRCAAERSGTSPRRAPSRSRPRLSPVGWRASLRGALHRRCTGWGNATWRLRRATGRRTSPDLAMCAIGGSSSPASPAPEKCPRCITMISLRRRDSSTNGIDGEPMNQASHPPAFALD